VKSDLAGFAPAIAPTPPAHFCVGSVAKLGPAATATGGATAVVVTDAGMLATPVIDAVQTELDEAGIPFIVFSGVHANPTTDDLVAGAEVVGGLALRVINMVGTHLAVACADGAGAETKAHMLLTAHMAGIGMASTGLGMVHAVGHALGGRYDIAHGVALALVLPQVLEFSAPARLERLASIGFALGAGNAGKDSGWNAAAAIDALADEVLINAPRQPDAADVAAVLTAASACGASVAP
jgi:alcohol dehydrogenase class IV